MFILLCFRCEPGALVRISAMDISEKQTYIYPFWLMWLNYMLWFNELVKRDLRQKSMTVPYLLNIYLWTEEEFRNDRILNYLFIRWEDISKINLREENMYSNKCPTFFINLKLRFTRQHVYVVAVWVESINILYIDMFHKESRCECIYKTYYVQTTKLFHFYSELAVCQFSLYIYIPVQWNTNANFTDT